MVSPRIIALKLEYHLFTKERALLRGLVPPKVQAYLRRRARAKYLLWDARRYNAWMRGHLQRRRVVYEGEPERGLLSIVTPVWDGSPLPYLKKLAESIARQNATGACEWVLLDNGCRKPELLAYFEKLRDQHWIAVHHSATNTGIIGGLRRCLEYATGRYILPVDADDLIYPDCLRVVTWWIHKENFPPLLYSDEDKLLGAQAVQPYLKPDFDPVLLLNSAYIAHLGVIDRERALQLGAYSDQSVEGTPDWDLFVRFFLAGHAAVHIPEVIYSWRMHAESTAADALSKPYIHSSQKAMLQRYLEHSNFADRYTVEYSPLLGKTADWWLKRKHDGAWPAMQVRLDASGNVAGVASGQGVRGLADLVKAQAGESDALVCLVADDLEIDCPDWLWDAISLVERYPDTVMIGGRIRDSRGTIVSAGEVLGFRGDCGCPDRGRPVVDPGYFTQILKQRSVSAVSSQFAVVRAHFLRELAASVPAGASIPFLGAWAGALALRSGKRIVYSPFLSALSTVDWDALVPAAERTAFREMNAALLPDQRFYPRVFSLTADNAYRIKLA